MMEDKQLSKGIFWIIDIENFEDDPMIFRIPVDPMGIIDDSVDRAMLNSKQHENYNHKKKWEILNTKVTRNKRFDHYPRGRVEIRQHRAIIYATPCICTEEIIDFIRNEFNLTDENGIRSVCVIPDYSEHYKCHFDE